jgi:hypothetical protein
MKTLDDSDRKKSELLASSMNIGDCVRVANQNSSYKQGIGVITGSFAGNWVVYFIEIDLEVVFGEWELIKLCDLKTFLALSKPTEKNPLSAPDYPPAPSGSQAMPYKRDGFTSKSKQG